MIKRLIAFAALATLSSACATPPAAAATADLCDLIPATELEREFYEPLKVTKRLVNQRESEWAYCLYGTATEHFLTVGAPLAHAAGNVQVVAGPGVDAAVAETFEKSANGVGGFALQPVDIPSECVALQNAAESVIGTIHFARGTVDETSLTCDFIGADGSIGAQTRPQAFARAEDLTGVPIVTEPDAVAKGIKNAKTLTIDGVVDHSQLTITVTPDAGYSAASVSEAERAFARRFLEASW